MSALENVTAASKLRRDKMIVEDELKEKRADYKRRMEAVKAKDEQLKQDRADLQEELVKFYKYIQDNEIKRNRANKKFAAEEKAKKDRHQKWVDLSEQLRKLERVKNETKELHEKYHKYQVYLESVLQHGDNEEYQDPKDIIQRFKTLDDNQNVLQDRKNQLEEDLRTKKSNLQMRKQRNHSEKLEQQNQLNELQNQLSDTQRYLKEEQEKLDATVKAKSETTRTIGQVGMACQNLYERCKEEVEKLKAKSVPSPTATQAQSKTHATTQGESSGDPNAKKKKAHDEAEKDMLGQLEFIGNCLDDYSSILAEWKPDKKKRE